MNRKEETFEKKGGLNIYIYISAVLMPSKRMVIGHSSSPDHISFMDPSDRLRVMKLLYIDTVANRSRVNTGESLNGYSPLETTKAQLKLHQIPH